MVNSARTALAALALACAASNAFAQPSPRPLLDRPTGPPPQARGLSVATLRQAFVRADVRALTGERIELALFEDMQVVARRTGRSHPRTGSTIWQGTLEAPYEGEVTLAAVDDVVAGSLTVDGRSFEIGFAGGGLHEVREMNPAAFPDEVPPLDAGDLLSTSGSTTTTATVTSSEPAGQIDVMVVWTPAARTAAGGTAAAIQSVIDLAMANANASYANSQVPARLRLVYSGEASYAEQTSNISSDLSRLRGTVDGYMDHIHSLRTQYSADIVTLIGSGYAKAGYCGIGYLMSSPSTTFSSSAFNIVDQSCAAGNLTYAHEVGHNQGLQHDPANAGGTPSHQFAYGYQDPSNAFRTVMSYGSAPRIQRLSNPHVFYAGKVTGTSMQNNAEALRLNTSIVAGFRAAATETCTYAVTPTSMTFSDTGGSASVEVSTTAGCAWTASSPAAWAAVGPGGSGPGSVLVSVAPNTGGQRTTTVTVASIAVTIVEHAPPASQPPPPSPCSFTVSPTSVAFASSGGTAEVTVSTQSGCEWAAKSNTGWLKVFGGGTGSGVATLQLGTTKGARSATATIAGQTVSVTQAGTMR